METEVLIDALLCRTTADKFIQKTVAVLTPEHVFRECFEASKKGVYGSHFKVVTQNFYDELWPELRSRGFTVEKTYNHEGFNVYW